MVIRRKEWERERLKGKLPESFSPPPTTLGNLGHGVGAEHIAKMHRKKVRM